MSELSGSTRRWFVCSAYVVVSALATACGGSSGTTGDTVANTAAGGDSPKAAVPTNPDPIKPSGELHKPLAQMSGNDFSDWVTGKLAKPFPQWVNQKKGPRRCEGKQGCQNKQVVTEVEIAASSDAHAIDLESLTKDRVVARMRVVPRSDGTKNPDEAKYKLKSDGGWYYLVIQPPPNPGQPGKRVANWVLLAIEANGHRPIGRGVFMRCCDPTKPNDPHCIASDFSYASFEECSMDHRVYRSLLRSSPGRLTSVTVQDTAGKEMMDLFSAWRWNDDGSAWVTCSHGCCIAGT